MACKMAHQTKEALSLGLDGHFLEIANLLLKREIFELRDVAYFNVLSGRKNF